MGFSVSEPRRTSHWGGVAELVADIRRHGPYILLSPAILVLLGVTVYPLIHSLVLSLHDDSGAYIGLRNYLEALRGGDFLQAWGRTFLFSVLGVIAETILGLALALAIDSRFVQQKAFLQTAFIIPMMIAPIAVGVTWRIMFHPLIGVINYFLSWFGIMPVPWLSNPNSAFIAVLLVEIWRGTPFMFLLLYAGLQAIPKDMYEAAALDGASPLKMFVDITIKWLRPTMLLAIALRILDMFTVFDEVMGATSGGPGTATEMITIHIYKTTFRFHEFNVGAAMSIIFLVVSVIIATAILKHSFREGAE